MRPHFGAVRLADEVVVLEDAAMCFEPSAGGEAKMKVSAVGVGELDEIAGGCKGHKRDYNADAPFR